MRVSGLAASLIVAAALGVFTWGPAKGASAPNATNAAFPMLGESAGPEDAAPAKILKGWTDRIGDPTSLRLLKPTAAADYFLAQGKQDNICLLRVPTKGDGHLALSCAPAQFAVGHGVLLAVSTADTPVRLAVALPRGYSTVRLSDGRTVGVHEQMFYIEYTNETELIASAVNPRTGDTIPLGKLPVPPG